MSRFGDVCQIDTWHTRVLFQSEERYQPAFANPKCNSIQPLKTGQCHSRLVWNRYFDRLLGYWRGLHKIASSFSVWTWRGKTYNAPLRHFAIAMISRQHCAQGRYPLENCASRGTLSMSGRPSAAPMCASDVIWINWIHFRSWRLPFSISVQFGRNRIIGCSAVVSVANNSSYSNTTGLPVRIGNTDNTDGKFQSSWRCHAGSQWTPVPLAEALDAVRFCNTFGIICGHTSL